MIVQLVVLFCFCFVFSCSFWFAHIDDYSTICRRQVPLAEQLFDEAEDDAGAAAAGGNDSSDDDDLVDISSKKRTLTRGGRK